MARGWDGKTPRIEGAHGNYLPGDDITWEKLTTDHHRVFLWRFKPGNEQRRTRIVIGEVRRHTPGLSYANSHRSPTRLWRAFPEGGPVEYPEPFDTHVLALEYLKNRWEMGSAVPESPLPQRSRRKRAAKPEVVPEPVAKPEVSPSWMKTFGDLWGEDAG